MKLFNAVLKWLASFALALTAGLLIIIFLSPKPELGDFILRLFLLAATGFIGGLAVRILFRRTHILATLILTLISNLLAVLTIDHFYINAFQFLFLGADFQLNTPTISDISQFIFISLVAMLPLLAFRRKTSHTKTKTRQVPNPKKLHKSTAQILHPIATKADPRNWQVWQKAKSISIIRPKSKPAVVEKPVLAIPRPDVVQKSSQPPVTIRKNTAVKTKVNKLKLPASIFKGSQNDVKLVGEEEHVCPYCLEEVVKNDSRGVKICPECGTWHHDDCWSLTGSCGVAHRTEI